MIAHIRYADLETNRSDEIYESTFWCYFNAYGDSTRKVHDPLSGKNKKRRIPLTIAAKVSSRKTNRKIHKKYFNWLGIRRFWKQLLNIPEAIPKGEEKAYKFKEQQEVAAAEAERCEKKKREERQRQLQAKYQRLKQD